MPPRLSVIRGSRARVLVLALVAVGLLWVSPPRQAVAQVNSAQAIVHGPEISAPARARVSGRILFLAHGLGRHVRRVIFRLDGRRLWVRSSRPFGRGGWIYTRRLRAGWHELTIDIVYRRYTRVLRKAIYIARHPVHHARATASAARSAAALLGESWRGTGPGGVFTPLPDSVAAGEVVPAPETRPMNTAANHYVPTAAQLRAFRSALDPWGRTPVQANPYFAYVTGDFTGTTDEIIQWAAAKWGIPADWLRAEYMWESHWCDTQLGDRASVSPAVYNEYPPQARVPGTYEVYESMGISQVKWIPDGSIGNGTEPLRWESTAFNADYQAALVRFFYDDPNGLWTKGGDPGYQPRQQWNSIGGWYNPWPWGNSGQLAYVQFVQNMLVHETWTKPVSCR